MIRKPKYMKIKLQISLSLLTLSETNYYEVISNCDKLFCPDIFYILFASL